MKRNLIALALVAGLGMAGSASAQSYDDRWYLTFGGGYAFFDGDRNVDNELYGTLGVGKFITPNFSLDLELWHSNPELNYDYLNEERNWELMGLSLTGRYHFGEADRWRPYVAFGLGGQEHHDGTQRQALRYGFNQSRTGSDMVGILGFGVQGALWHGSLRAEIGERFDMDDGGNDPVYTVGGPVVNPLGFNGDNNEDGSYYDGYVGLTYVLPLGDRDEPVAVVPVAPQKTCADLDDDADGVNNCDDKCPGTAAGTGIGADGCPVPAPEPAPVEEPKPFRG
jgi:OOP family OmpA-OmpF porin